jgi:hypothetical protein
VSLDSLSDGDPLKWDMICEKNVVWFLNALSYYKDKTAMIEELRKTNNGT